MSAFLNDSFKTVGGTMDPKDPSYVSRKADDELYDGLSRGEYCFVLTSRQMGKSSLAIRIAERLRAEETTVAQLDLTTVGHALNPEQWYYGLLFSLGEQLDLQGELEEFWQSHEDLGPLQRWMQSVHDVILERCPGPVVLIIDEIDYVRRLPFSTDEFFAAIRACFNRRADDPPMRRLSFCLLGTVTPSELIEDPNTTPFNIGRRIELNDFTEAEAATLARGLGRDEQTAARLMRRIYHWTGGQPYLTQSFCRAVAEAPQVVDATGVDRICQSLFFTGHARATDKNLQFVGGHLLNQEDQRRASLLDLYAKVHCGRAAIPDDETNPLCATLRLSGLVRRRRRASAGPQPDLSPGVRPGVGSGEHAGRGEATAASGISAGPVACQRGGGGAVRDGGGGSVVVPGRLRVGSCVLLQRLCETPGDVRGRGAAEPRRRGGAGRLVQVPPEGTVHAGGASGGGRQPRRVEPQTRSRDLSAGRGGGPDAVAAARVPVGIRPRQPGAGGAREGPGQASEFRVFGIAVNSYATSRIGRLSNHNIEK